MSTSAFDHLSPVFPQRAPWGTASRLRAWQQEALDQYLATNPRDFLAVATPGAGKTTFALRIASELLHRRIVDRVTVVCPTEHLKVQWAEAAARVGIQLDPGLGGHSRRGRSRQFHGVAVTYAGVAARQYAYRPLTEYHKTLVILDEVHHVGDSLSWGDAVADAFAPATRRLALTGTPFRSDDHPIPFVTYEELPDGSRQSRADYSYGYADALRDGVVRPVVFMAYGGDMRWRTNTGDHLEANLGELLPKGITAHAWRTALDPRGAWISAVLRSADTRLTEVRRHVPDAGGLVIAGDQTLARAYAKLLTDITGEAPALVLSDDPASSKRIGEFSESTDRWMVAVRMVSEGVDVPRLAVGVYATSTQTPLFFAQAVGRFVRTRRRGELATVFLPTVPVIMAHAASLEQQRDHVIGRPTDRDAEWNPEEALLAAAQREQNTPDFLEGFEALDSNARFDHALFDSRAYGLTSTPLTEDEEAYLGLPGLLEPDQISHVLAERERRQQRAQTRRDKKERVPQDVALYRELATRRKELNRLVAICARTQGRPHSHVHADLRRQCGGPALAQCTAEQVEARIATVRTWL